MSDRALMPAPDPRGGGGWLDTYVADGQLVAYQPRQQLIDISAIRGILFRQRWLVAGVVGLALIGGLVATLLMTPVYKASASVVVDPIGLIITEEQAMESAITLRTAGEKFLTQVEIIKSRKTASEVAQKLKLGERYDFLGADIDERRPPNRTDEQWLRDKQQIAAGLLSQNVSVDVPGDNFVLIINYTSGSPAMAAEIANAYADLFAESDTRTKIEENDYSKQYLEEQIELVRSRLEAAEIKANDFARNSGIVVQQPSAEGGETGVTLTTANLVSINQRVSEARARRIEAEQRWRSLQNLPASQLPEVQGNAVLQRLVGERSVLETRLSDLKQRYSEDFPQIVSLKDQIAIIDENVERIAAEIKATVRGDYVVARNQEEALERELGSVKGDTLAEQDKRVGFGVLEREAQALRDRLRSLLDRYNSVNTATNADTGQLTKLDAATVPTSPESPSLVRNMGLALVFGIALAGGLAVLAVRMLTVDGLAVNSLDQIRIFAGAVVLPLLTAWALARWQAARVSVDGDLLRIDMRSARIEVPLGSIVTIRPWRTPLSSAGCDLVLTSGRRLGARLGLRDPRAFAAMLEAAGSPARLATPVDRHIATLAAIRATDGSRWFDRAWFRFGLFPLLPAVIAFRLHQVIVFGGPFGEWMAFGPRAWLVGLAIWWAAWALGLMLFASVLRLAIEATTLVGLARGEAASIHARALATGIARVAYLAGVPLLLVTRML